MLALMQVDLIRKPGRGNVVSDVLNRRDEVQAMKTIQVLKLMFTNEGTLWCEIKEGYVNNLKDQRL